MMRACAAALALAALPLQALAQDDATWASKLDYTLNASRDRPIVCKAGDIERHPGKSLAQLFGDRWPRQPDPAPGSDRVRAQTITSVRNGNMQRGTPSQRGLVVFAVLVDASGKPLQVEMLCATTEGYDAVSKRMAMRARYKPAVINGNPVTSVVVQVQTYEKDGG